MLKGNKKIASTGDRTRVSAPEVGKLLLVKERNFALSLDSLGFYRKRLLNRKEVMFISCFKHQAKII